MQELEPAVQPAAPYAGGDRGISYPSELLLDYLSLIEKPTVQEVYNNIGRKCWRFRYCMIQQRKIVPAYADFPAWDFLHLMS